MRVVGAAGGRRAAPPGRTTHPGAAARTRSASGSRPAACAARTCSCRRAASATRSRLPVVPGHEAAGVVDALGRRRDRGRRRRPGRPVLHHDARRTTRGRHAAARTSARTSGGWASTSTGRSPSTCCVRRPPWSGRRRRSPPPVLAVLTDAVATPLHGLKRVARLQAGRDARRARRRWARLQRRPARQGVRGAGHRGHPLRGEAAAGPGRWVPTRRSPADEGDPVAAVKALTGGHGPDVVIQCVGSAAVDEQAIAMGGPGRSGRADRIEPRRLPGAGRGHLLARAVGARLARLRAGRHPRRDRPVPRRHARRGSSRRGRCGPLEEANEALEDLKAGRVFRSVLAPA